MCSLFLNKKSLSVSRFTHTHTHIHTHTHTRTHTHTHTRYAQSKMHTKKALKNTSHRRTFLLFTPFALAGADDAGGSATSSGTVSITSSGADTVFAELGFTLTSFFGKFPLAVSRIFIT